MERVEVIIYCHEIVSGSDLGMHFSGTLKEAKAAATEYREAFRRFDPDGGSTGALGIYEMVLRMPDVGTMIDLLNSPESIFRTCLQGGKCVAAAID
ncbi:hypothetical protein ACCS55_15830 [Rhizobium ruizarguesonis]